jgi:hypothetical protein
MKRQSRNRIPLPQKPSRQERALRELKNALEERGLKLVFPADRQKLCGTIGARACRIYLAVTASKRRFRVHACEMPGFFPGERDWLTRWATQANANEHPFWFSVESGNGNPQIYFVAKTTFPLNLPAAAAKMIAAAFRNWPFARRAGKQASQGTD